MFWTRSNWQAKLLNRAKKVSPYVECTTWKALNQFIGTYHVNSPWSCRLLNNNSLVFVGAQTIFDLLIHHVQWPHQLLHLLQSFCQTTLSYSDIWNHDLRLEMVPRRATTNSGESKLTHQLPICMFHDGVLQLFAARPHGWHGRHKDTSDRTSLYDAD